MKSFFNLHVVHLQFEFTAAEWDLWGRPLYIYIQQLFE